MNMDVNAVSERYPKLAIQTKNTWRIRERTKEQGDMILSWFGSSFAWWQRLDEGWNQENRLKSGQLNRLALAADRRHQNDNLVGWYPGKPGGCLGGCKALKLILEQPERLEYFGGIVWKRSKKDGREVLHREPVLLWTKPFPVLFPEKDGRLQKELATGPS